MPSANENRRPSRGLTPLVAGAGCGAGGPWMKLRTLAPQATDGRRRRGMHARLTTGDEVVSLLDPPLMDVTGVVTQPDEQRAPRRLRRPWLLLLISDAAGLLLPAVLRHDGRRVIVGFVALSVLLMQQAGLYRSRLHLSVLDDLPTILSRAVVSAVIMGVAVDRLRLKPLLDVFVGLAVLAVVSQVVTRFLAYRVIHLARARGSSSHPTLILGGGLVAAQLAATLSERPQYGLRPIGFLDVDPRWLNEPAGSLTSASFVTSVGCWSSTRSRSCWWPSATSPSRR